MPTERADAIIKLIESQIETNRQLTPKFPIEDSPQINTTDIEMTSLPIYEVGDKVSKMLCYLLFFLNTWDSFFTLISMDEQIIRWCDT